MVLELQNQWKSAFFFLLVGSIITLSGWLYVMSLHFERQLKEAILHTNGELEETILGSYILSRLVAEFPPHVQKEILEKKLSEVIQETGTEYVIVEDIEPDGTGTSFGFGGLRFEFDEKELLQNIAVTESYQGKSDAVFHNRNLKDYLSWNHPFEEGGAAMWRGVIHLLLLIVGLTFYMSFELKQQKEKYLRKAMFCLFVVLFLGFADLFWQYNVYQIKTKQFVETARALPIYPFLEGGKIWIIYPTYLMNIVLLDFLILVAIYWRSRVWTKALNAKPHRI